MGLGTLTLSLVVTSLFAARLANASTEKSLAKTSYRVAPEGWHPVDRWGIIKAGVFTGHCVGVFKKSNAVLITCDKILDSSPNDRTQWRYLILDEITTVLAPGEQVHNGGRVLGEVFIVGEKLPFDENQYQLPVKRGWKFDVEKTKWLPTEGGSAFIEGPDSSG